MRHIQTDILVIGGGATGTGILRDLAMRGFKAILVEKRDLTHGTTGRFHGLLHSGGRYVVKDPHAAKECIQENRILRRIMPGCIEDTGGFFVLTPEDNPDYIENFLVGCHEAKIPVEEITQGQMLRKEPLLDPKITRCFHVPDAAVDSFAAAHANVASATAYGAKVLTYHEVLHLIEHNGHIMGAACHDLIQDEQVIIHADLTINAAGAWVGKIVATIGVDINIRPGKGTMLAVSQRIVNTVINRCKIPSDGDILVPSHTVAVMGTTDCPVSDPDHFAIEPWEVQRMLSEGEKLIPGFKTMRILRAWAGVRPLYQETKTKASRDITRSFVLLDHEIRDGVTGLLTITGGKWTTYRKMAEVTVDKICEKLGTQRTCHTHSESLPTEGHKLLHRKPYATSLISGHHQLGHRLAKIEIEKSYGSLMAF
jgi:glycerol-3-phosphate dehydrogenase